MQKRLVQILAVLVTALAVGGFMVEDDHLLGLTNADMAMDITRLSLAAILLFVGFGKSSASTVRGALVLFGMLYVGLAVLGLLDSELWGLLPTGLTGFDIVFHLAAGIVALGAAFMNNSDRSVVDA